MVGGLERESKTELDLAAGAGDRVPDAAEGGGIGGCGGEAKSGRVGQVGGVGANFDFFAFADGDVLLQRRIEVEEAVAGEEVTRGVALLTGDGSIDLELGAFGFVEVEDKALTGIGEGFTHVGGATHAGGGGLDGV